MTVKQAAKGVVSNIGTRTYDIDFINSDGEVDETQFDAKGTEELSEIYSEFCKENGFKSNTVISITDV
jgi:hypothetical protein